MGERAPDGLDQLDEIAAVIADIGQPVVVAVLGLGVEGDLEGRVEAKAVGDRVRRGTLRDSVEIVEHQLVGDLAADDLVAALGGRKQGEGGEPFGVGALVAMGGERVGAQGRVGDRGGAGVQPALGGSSGGEDVQPVAPARPRGSSRAALT